MSICSSHQVCFEQNLRLTSLRLYNPNAEPIVFKISCTNVGVLKAAPNTGFLNSNTKLNLLLRSLTNHSFQEKLQLSYACIPLQPLTFEEAWNQATCKSLIRYEIVKVKSSEQEIEIQPTEYIKASRYQRKISMVNHNSIEFQETICTGEEVQELRTTIERLERKICQENMKNKRLKQQLESAEQGIREANDRIKQCSNSLEIACEQQHASFSFLVFLALCSFMLGFIFAS